MQESYSSVEDMLIGDVQSGILNKENFVRDAAKEIDAKIGVRYQTPVDLAILERHSRLLLERINNHIASGRFLMAANAGDDSIHSYGRMLVREAYQELELIANGSLPLEGADVQDWLTDTTGPTIRSQDEESALDAFYAPVLGGRLVRSPWEPGGMS